MNPLDNKFVSLIKNFRLSDGEKTVQKNALLAEMSTHPLSESPKVSPQTGSVRNRADGRHLSRRKQLTRTNIFTRMPIAILIAMLMGGGVSFAAADTVPGDALYPVKIHVNENVESAVTIGDVAKATFQAELAVRRLKEAEQLESEHKLDAETKAELKSNFDEHTQDVEARLKLVEKDNQHDADDISSKFETSLHGHVNALGLLGIDVTGNNIEEVSTPESKGTTTTMKKKRVDILLNAVFRANDDTDEHADAQATSRGSIENEIDSNGDGASHEGAKNETDSRAQGGSTSSVKVGGIIKVDTNTNIEVKHDESSQSGKLELRGENDGKIKLGL